MERFEIKNRITNYFREQIVSSKTSSSFPRIQVGFIQELFKEEINALPTWQQDGFRSIAREIVHEFIIMGALYPGERGQIYGSEFYPFITITEYGKEVFTHDEWLPYDPDGYIKALKTKVPNIDDVTLIYVGEAIATYHKRQLLSATIMLGVASENLMLLLIEAYLVWLNKIDQTRKTALERKIKDKFIFTQYKWFKLEFQKNVKDIPKNLQSDWETYLDGVFNFIRLNRNSAGHPTGKNLDAKTVYANLQIFADYAKYIFDLIKHCS